MKKCLFVFVCYFISTVLNAQSIIQWQKTFGGSSTDEATCVQQTTDGGYILTGYTFSQNGDVSGYHGTGDAWAIKLNILGSVEWKKVLGGSNLDWPNCIQQALDGGYIIAGFTESNDGDVSGNHGGKDAWVVKLSHNGTVEWQKALGGSDWDEAWSIQTDTDGGYLVGGRSNSVDGDASGNSGGNLDCWVVKLSNTGTVQWQKAFGGNDTDTAHSIRQTTDGGYIMVGEAKSSDGDVMGNNGDVDFWVVKINNLGIVEWQNALGGSGLDTGIDIQEIADGFIAFGYAGSNDGDISGNHGLYDFWIVRLDPAGNLLWQKTLGGSDADWGYAGTLASNGGYVIAGTTRSNDGDVLNNDGGQDIWVVKLDTFGEMVWQKTLGGSQAESCNSIWKTNDGGYVLAGKSSSNNGDVSGNHGGSDFWVVKLSPETVNLQSLEPTPLNLYPNPAHESISITSAANDPIKNITITDLLGRNCLQQSAITGGLLDIGTLPKGLYLVLATGVSGKGYVGKLRKE